MEGAGDAEVEEVGAGGGGGAWGARALGFGEGGVVLGFGRGAFAPAALEEAVVEEVGVAEVAEAFGCAHVEPDAEVGFGAGAADAVKDGALVPPDAGREDGGFAEDVGVVEGEGEGDEATEG